MPGSPNQCERAQLALIEGREEEWVAAHVAGCSECRFFADLSSQLASADRAKTSAAASDLGSAFEAILDQAVAVQRPLARYRLEGRVGRGGQGVVYRAVDSETGETVALKVVRSRLSGPDTAASEVALAHLVPHPNVCRVYHTERHGEVRLIVMELVDGNRLDEALPRLSPAQRLSVFRKVCEAVSAAHAVGVLHLDLKPSNILVRASGEPTVTDFGLALKLAADERPTARGGTRGYMGAEQRDGRGVDQRTDVYALGIILGELFPGGSRGLKRVIARATAESPQQRYPDVRSLLHDLDRPARLRRQIGRLAVGLALLALLGLGLMPFKGASRARGDVLVLGGRGADGQWTASAEVFDAKSGRWRTIEPVPDPGLSRPRTCQMHAVRSGDDVLALGGGAASGCEGATTNRVRVYSLANGNWSVPECQAPCIEHEGVTFWLDRSERDQRRRWKKGVCRPEGPCMLYGRNSFVGLALPNDDVFVYGGCAGACDGPNELDQFRDRPTPMFRMAELYRRATGTWQPVAPSLFSRPLAGGVNVGIGVLVCGGYDDRTPQPYDQHDTCEVFERNKDKGAWRPAGRMPVGATRGSLTMVSLRGDIVLGLQPGHAWLWRQKDWWGDAAEWRWDDSFFEPLALPLGGQLGGTLTRLRGGRALLVGATESDRVVPTAQVFTLGPGAKGGTWREVAPMRQARRDHAAVTLEDGRILVVGGCGPEPLSSAEVYDPVNDRWVDAGHMPTTRCSPQAVALW